MDHAGHECTKLNGSDQNIGSCMYEFAMFDTCYQNNYLPVSLGNDISGGLQWSSYIAGQ